jgi:hypothetical protein
MRVERAEAPGERGMLVGGQILIAEEDDLVFQDRLFDFVANGIRKRLPKVDPADFRADMRLQWFDPDMDV